MTPTDAELNEKLADDLKPKLHAALDALLAGANDPLQRFLTEDLLDGGFPDVWVQAAAYLYKVDPSEVSQQMRVSVKHGCHHLLHPDQERPLDSLIRGLLAVRHPRDQYPAVPE